MFARLFPRSFDNAYRGRWPAAWILCAVVLLRLVIGFNSMAFPYRIATTADAIPLDRFSPEASAEVVHEFSLLGLSLFAGALLGLLVLVRYRGAIPFFFLLLLLQQAGSRLLAMRAGEAMVLSSPGTWITLGVLATTILGLILSLWDRPARA
jgi:hypothetical protein